MKFLKANKKTQRPTLSRSDALRCVPVVNLSVQVVESESGEILLEYPLQIKPFFQSVFERFQKEQGVPTKKLQLDEMGSVVWKLINGKNSAQAIISQFAKTYGITLQEAEKSVTAFLVELGKRGIIALG